MTIIREPIQRCISHYSWAVSRRYVNVNDDIDELFKNNKIPANAIVNQFSGIGLSNANSDKSVDLAFHNLRNKIDFLYDVDDFFKLLSFIISLYDLPNLFFQKQQVNYNKIYISEKTIAKIKKYNELDIILYKKLIQDKLIKNCTIKKYEKRKTKVYLYSSPELLVNKQKTFLLSEPEIQKIEKKLIQSKYKIQVV